MVMKGLVFRFVLAVISGYLLYFFASYSYPVSIFPFFGFVPIFWLIFSSKSKREALIDGTIIGSVFGLLLMNGLLEEHSFWLYLICSFMSGLKYLLIVYVTFIVTRQKSITSYSFYSALIWTIFDYLASFVKFVPASPLAHAFAFDPVWLQVLDITGPWGPTFLLVFVSSSITLCLSTESYQKINIQKWNIALCILGISASYLYGKFPSVSEVNQLNVNLAVIQGGVSSEIIKQAEKDIKVEEQINQWYLSMTKKAIETGHHNIVWPEASTTAFILMQNKIKENVNTKDVLLLGGFPNVEFISSPNKGIRKSRLYNSAILINSNGEKLDKYDKQILVPITEQSFDPGTSTRPISSPWGKIATPICFEILFPSHIRELVANGAEAIVLLSSDNYFGKSGMSMVLFKVAVMRAIENRRYVLRAARSGISGLISAEGKIIKTVGPYTPAIMPATIKTYSNRTFYNRYGDWFIFVLVAGLLVAQLPKLITHST